MGIDYVKSQYTAWFLQQQQEEPTELFDPKGAWSTIKSEIKSNSGNNPPTNIFLDGEALPLSS
eukprot:12638651-Prorocentrum_lima.AAC.1